MRIGQLFFFADNFQGYKRTTTKTGMFPFTQGNTGFPLRNHVDLHALDMVELFLALRAEHLFLAV
jgi:hypothetical protein